MSDHIYFGGSSVFDGKVRRLQATNFKELVDCYIHVPVRFPFSRREFHALDEATRNKKKDSAFICAASYDFEEGKREDDTATSVNLVVLDLDEGDFIRDFFEAPNTVGEHLYPYNYALWTTAKHTIKTPRLKIMVDVTPCHPSQYRRMVRFIADRLGLPENFKGLRESRVLSQPQYRPAQFHGEEHPTAVLASRTSGIALSESDIPDAIDAEGNELSSESDRVFACDRGDDFDNLSILHLPVFGLTVEDIREPLFAVDADCGYKEWVEIASALRHQFTDEDEARQAYDMFDEWSAQGSKYKGEKETFSKWRSFRPYAKGRAPVTIRTLFHVATKLGGWENTRIASKLKQTALEWINTNEDQDELMMEGAKKIAALPFRNELVDDTLITCWKKRLRELSGHVHEKTVLKRLVSKERKRGQAEKDAAMAQTGSDNMPEWLQAQCYIATENVFFHIPSMTRLSPQGFDNKFAKELMPKDAAEVPANGRPVAMPTAYALNLRCIKRVDETIYYPLHEGNDPYFSRNGKTFLNIYDKYDCPVPDPDYAERAMKLFSEHIRHMMPEPWLAELFINYHAFIVQNPGKKIRWSFLIQSAEGAGKGFFAKIFASVIGRKNVVVVSPEVLKSQWNDWAKDTLYIVWEEVHIPGEQRERVTNSIKQVITDDTITVNKRNTHAQCDVPNYATGIAFTNYTDALHLKDTSRRWTIVYSALQSAESIQRLNETGHFERMDWLLSPEGSAGLRFALLTHKIPDTFPVNGPAPATKYRDNIIEVSKNPLQIAVEDAIADGEDPLVSKDLVFVPRLASLTNCIARDAHRLNHYLTYLGYQPVDQTRHVIGGEKGFVFAHASYVEGEVPAVEVLRRRLELNDFEV